MGWQIEAVKKALGEDAGRVRGAVCFTEAEWGWGSRSFLMNEVLVTGPTGLAQEITKTGDLAPEGIIYLGTVLHDRLPNKTQTKST